MTNFISSREKLHCSAQELHAIYKWHRITISNNTMSGIQYYYCINHAGLQIAFRIAVEFRSLIEYVINDFCARGLTFRH